MQNPTSHPQIQNVQSMEELLQNPFVGEVNVLQWPRELQGDFAEIVAAFELEDDLMVLEPQDLEALELSPAGALARETLLGDYQALLEFGAQPTINLLRAYPRDLENPVFPTDVYSFHVDRSPVPTSTFLCTYHGDPSEFLPNPWARPKIQNESYRVALQLAYESAVQAICESNVHGQPFDLSKDASTDSSNPSNSIGTTEDAYTYQEFIQEHFYDLHFEALADAPILRQSVGHVWRLAVDHPDSPVLPCIHRAPVNRAGWCG